jgi:hypothetical protein
VHWSQAIFIKSRTLERIRADRNLFPIHRTART